MGVGWGGEGVSLYHLSVLYVFVYFVIFLWLLNYSEKKRREIKKDIFLITRRRNKIIYKNRYNRSLK
jgi:hypothetical protein